MHDLDPVSPLVPAHLRLPGGRVLRAGNHGDIEPQFSQGHRTELPVSDVGRTDDDPAAVINSPLNAGIQPELDTLPQLGGGETQGAQVLDEKAQVGDGGAFGDAIQLAGIQMGKEDGGIGPSCPSSGGMHQIRYPGRSRGKREIGPGRDDPSRAGQAGQE